MASVSVSKHHGLGNDFLVLVANTEANRGVDLSIPAAAELARRICDRHRGIGADGLLLALGVTEAERVQHDVSVRMRLHNADGSVAEMSGNGIRCFVQGLLDGNHADVGTIRVLTDAGVREVTAASSDPSGIAWIRVDMGTALVNSFPVPTEVQQLIGERRVLTVDVGNPHIVIADDPSSIDIGSFGPAVEQHFMKTSGGINVEVVAASKTKTGDVVFDALDMVVWERGVGITQACGTGAVASAVAAHQWAMVGAHSEVRQPGGNASVEINGDQIFLIGPSQAVADCVFTW
jgi:diaminopimelate epimerase